MGNAGAPGAPQTPNAWHRLPARFPKLGLFADTAWAAAEHCSDDQVPVLLQKVEKAAARLALSWLYSCPNVNAETWERQSEHRAQGVRSQLWYLMHVSEPETGSQMQTAPVVVVMLHISLSLPQCTSSRQAP